MNWGYRLLLSLTVFFYFVPAVRAQSAPISIACIDDSGKSTNPAINCNPIMPKCSDLKSSNEKTVKNFLSWKIWGYYQGKNLDLNASTLSVTAPIFAGPDLMYPICSVVGHKMQFLGTPPLKSGADSPCDQSRASQAKAYATADIEYAQQTIGKKMSCGTRPNTASGSSTLTLKFQNGSGNLWNSYLIGAYPWLIRRYAYEVLTALKPDLSNLGDVISDPSVKADVAALSDKMNSYYAGLGTESKAICSNQNTDIVASCNNGTLKLSDPSNRLCTLVKAQNTLNTGALPNILVREIMARVQTNFDSLFSQIMTFKNAPSKNLWGKCKDTGSLFRSGKKKASMTASCLMDGGDFYTFGDNATLENDCGGSGSKHAKYPVVTRIGDGAALDMGSANSLGADKTLLLGFGGVVESVIRRDICKQQRYTDVSICDSINIPDKPDGMQ